MMALVALALRAHGVMSMRHNRAAHGELLAAEEEEEAIR